MKHALCLGFRFWQDSITFDLGLKLAHFVDYKSRLRVLKSGEDCYEEIIASFDVASFCFNC